MHRTKSHEELQNKFNAIERECQRYKERNEVLKNARQRFYSLSNRTQDGIYALNFSVKKYVYTNPSFIKIFGHRCKDIVTAASVMEKILPEDRIKLKEKIEASLSNQTEGDEIEYRCISHDGSIRWMHDRWIVLRDGNGFCTSIEGIVRDVTEMKDIIGLKDYLEHILESCMDAIIVTNDKGIITMANRGAEPLFHAKRMDLVGSFIGDVMKYHSCQEVDVYKNILAHAPTSNYEMEACIPDGSVIPLLISSAFLTDAQNEAMGTISYIRDISSRKKTEERIRTLSRQLIRTQEVERSSIARDLHDQLAQNLYSFNIQLTTFLKQALPDDKFAGQTTDLLDSLQKIFADIRKMVFNIYPAGLETLGIAKTINNLCKNIAQIYDLEIEFNAAGVDSLGLNFDIKIAIYRLVQESLNNIVKHAQATVAHVKLVYSYPNIILRIEDNGIGFNADLLMETTGQNGCMGIWSMKERVALLSGEMIIKSDEKQGTHIDFEIPYYENE
jgi:PAS domain S-box-containing protein